MHCLVAAASTDKVFVNSHFGHTKVYQIIDVDQEKEEWKIKETRVIDLTALPDKTTAGCFGHKESVVECVAEKLTGCQYILVSKIGPYPQKILRRYGYEVLETDMEIGEAIHKLIAFTKMVKEINR
jgi:nitrogen fixation protein NifX